MEKFKIKLITKYYELRRLDLSHALALAAIIEIALRIGAKSASSTEANEEENKPT